MGWATRVKGVLRLAKGGASDVELNLFAEITGKVAQPERHAYDAGHSHPGGAGCEV